MSRKDYYKPSLMDFWLFRKLAEIGFLMVGTGFLWLLFKLFGWIDP